MDFGANVRHGVKRKLEVNDEPKGRLAHVVQLLVGNPLKKGDIVYETTQLDGGRFFVSTVTLPSCPQFNTPFSGSPIEGKRAAEKSAAEEALRVLGPMVESVEHKAKKARISGKRAKRIKKVKDGNFWET